MPTGITTINFGAFPGKSDASVDVIGQTTITGTSLVEAWIRPVATSDHTDTEHMVETLKVFAAAVIVGTGFTIYGFNTSQLNTPAEPIARRSPNAQVLATVSAGLQVPLSERCGTLIYGQWTVAWAWA